MNHPLLIQRSVAAMLSAVACAGLTPGAVAQGSLRDLTSSRQPIQLTAPVFPQAGSIGSSLQGLSAQTLQGRTTQAAVGSGDCGPVCEQLPDLVDAYASDIDASRAVAENCTLTEATELCELVVWGTYAFGQTTPASDLFTLFIHADAAGLPGALVYTEVGIDSTRTSTGGLIVGLFEEFRYSLTPKFPVFLPAGDLWFEVINNTSADTDDQWFWETGTQDAVSGIAGSADAFEAPGATWLPEIIRDHAMQVCGKPTTFLMECPVGSDAVVIQPSDLISGYFSDVNPYNGYELVSADDFAFNERTEISEIRVKGAYGNFNTPSVPDDFTVIIHSDLAGLPGPTIYAESGVGVVRSETGAHVAFVFTEYEYVLTPSTTIVLDAGTYWLEVYNDTTGDDDSWAWITATVDPNGTQGHAMAVEAPGVTWGNSTDDLAFRICGKPADVCVSYCASLPNATGSAAVLTCSGLPNSSLVLTSSPVPNTTGQFFFGPMMLGGGSSLGDGLRCVGGSLTRLLPFISAGMMMQLPNTASFTVNYTAPYASGLTGTKYFQHWYRSGLGTGTGSNTSNAVSITF
ncbi:MAG: hypothetical protein ACI8QZ_004262 [Chlamydiales bacterium]|jgi:hypothetical protein